jgi:uncharacterized iron-regulated membrane protein
VSKEKKFGIRSLLILLHRWLGLFTALFLFIAGLTGAVIAWEHELDEWLNSYLFKTQPTAEGASKPLSLLALAEQVETADPQVRVTYLPLAVKPGHTLILFVEPRVNPVSWRVWDSTARRAVLFARIWCLWDWLLYA